MATSLLLVEQFSWFLAHSVEHAMSFFALKTATNFGDKNKLDKT